MRSMMSRSSVVLGFCSLMLVSLGFMPSNVSAQTQVKPRIVIIFDTSGSMLFDIDSTSAIPTWGDGSWDPYGGRFCCPGVGNSRLFAAKEAIQQMIYATGDIEFSLMKFAQEYSTDSGWEYLYYQSNQVSGSDDVIRYRHYATWGGACIPSFAPMAMPTIIVGCVSIFPPAATTIATKY